MQYFHPRYNENKQAQRIQLREVTDDDKPSDNTSGSGKAGGCAATIRKWIFTRKLPVVRVGRSVRLKEEDLEALIRFGYQPLRARGQR